MSDADKPEVRRANDNPWYCLATLHGEQAAVNQLNREIEAENRKAWNRWIAGALSDEQRTELVKNGFPEPELAPLSPEEKSAFYSAFAVRTGRENELPPGPADDADFANTYFDRGVAFGGFLFARRLKLGSATFSDFASFHSATFSGSAYFAKATFSGAADFGSATFSGAADFRSATFSSDANFFEATFSDITFFTEATFSCHADFSAATFSDHADFGAATFSSYANFFEATFFGHAGFGAATLSGPAYFNSATFSSDADFRLATFARDASFVNAKYAAHTIFALAGFETHVPDFRGATMHDATEWHGVSWPKPSQNKDDAQTQVYAYERLKLEMDRLKKHEDEQQFFRRELRARRGMVRPWSGEGLLNVVYEASSDYGHSINRPLVWLFWLFALGSSILTETPAFNSAPMTIPNAAKHSFANIFPFLPLNRGVMAADMAGDLSHAAQIIAVAQSLLGPLLLFLLGLALRNRFRMK